MFMVKKGDLTVNKDNKQGSSSNKDKSKAINKNRDVVNDGVIDNLTAKPPRSVFNLTTSLQAAKATEQATAGNKQTSNYSRSKPWALRPKREYTPLGEPLDVVFKTLVKNKIITPLENPRPYDPHPRPSWWNESAYCEYHRNKGHQTASCIQLRHKI